MAEIQIRVRRDTTANWTANNPTLGVGEVGLDTDKDRLKFGDGVTAWAALDFAPIPYDLRLGIVGVPTASQLAWLLIGRAATVLTADPGNAYCRTAPTAEAVFDIRKNGTSIGSVTFAAAANVGTVAVTVDTAFAVGDRLELVAPATADSTLADVQLHLRGLDR